MRNLVILLDPAHGADVKGKCSPDGQHKEYKWSRDRISSLRSMLTSLGFEVYVTTESQDEPGLSKRKNFATQVRQGSKKLLLSLHNNAAGDGSKWMKARGMEVWTTPGVTDSDVCADILLEQLHKDFPDVRCRVYKDSRLEKDKEERFTVLMGSGYMAVLLEWLFQDNHDDVKMLMDFDTNRNLELSLVNAIVEIDKYFSK